MKQAKESAQVTLSMPLFYKRSLRSIKISYCNVCQVVQSNSYIQAMEFLGRIRNHHVEINSLLTFHVPRTESYNHHIHNYIYSKVIWFFSAGEECYVFSPISKMRAANWTVPPLVPRGTRGMLIPPFLHFGGGLSMDVNIGLGIMNLHISPIPLNLCPKVTMHVFFKRQGYWDLVASELYTFVVMSWMIWCWVIMQRLGLWNLEKDRFDKVTWQWTMNHLKIQMLHFLGKWGVSIKNANTWHEKTKDHLPLPIPYPKNRKTSWLSLVIEPAAVIETQDFTSSNVP